MTSATWLMFAMCVAASVLAATAQRASVRSEAQRSFRETSGDVAASMASALRRTMDFGAMVGSTVALQPHMTNARFARWIESTKAPQRFPGGIGYAYIASVPASGLAAYGRLVVRDPPPGLLPAKRFTLLANPAPSYCLIRLAAGNSPFKMPLGLDLCSPIDPKYLPAGLALPASNATIPAVSAQTGQSAVMPIVPALGIYSILVPVYRGGLTPGTVAERRAALMGWVGITLSAQGVLAAAGGVKPGMQVQISHRNPAGLRIPIAASGSAGPDARVRTFSIDVEGEWTIRVAGEARSGSLAAGSQFWIILLAGIGTSGLLFGFVRVLARSRGRALDMVERKTAELRHLALHDSLTELPNRSLILDRVDSALARARRRDTPLAVMFLDLDGFKAVNDTFGHAAGDELLRAVANRLRGLLRDSDTVGRLGGDEFVVLAEGDSLAAGPEVIAERIQRELGTPFDLAAADCVRVQVSIGIAIGLRASAEDLLRDADIALYEAKETGKDRFVLFAQ